MWFQPSNRGTRQKRTQRTTLGCESLEDRRLLAADFLPGDAQIAPAVNDQQFVDIEPGGPGYLAVWTDERAVLSGFVNSSDPISGNAQDVYGQLLDQSGQPVGDPIVIANAGQNQAKPDLAWNESTQSWLVVFDSQDPDWYFDEQVYGVRVAADGNVLDQEPILLFEQDGNEGIFNADVASDGNDWTIVANKFHGAPLEGAIFGRRLAGDGSLLELQPTLIVQMDLMFPDIAYADNTYMIAAKGRTTPNVFVTRVDTALNPLGSTTFVGSGPYPGAHISSNGTEFMVVADSAYRITSAGQNLDPGGIPIGGSLALDAHRDVTWSGGEWSVGMKTTQSDVAVQRIDATGAIIDSQPIVVNVDAMDEQVAIAGDAGESVIVFSDRPGVDQDIRAAHIGSNGTASAPVDVSIGLSRQSSVTTVDGPNGENLAVYLSQFSGETRILSQRIADDGTVLDPEPTVVEVSALTTGAPEVAWNGSVYMVTWGNVAKRISATNQVLDAQPIVVSDLPIGAVAAAGDTFIVGVFEYHGFNEPLNYVRFVRVGGDGTILDATSHLVATGFAREMTAETFGDTAIIAWAQYGRHDSPYAYTQAAIIGANASINGPLRVSAELGGTPDIAVNGNQALIVYNDYTTIHQDDIEGRFVLANGTMPEGEFPIATAANEQIVPDASWIEDQYVVAWNDYRHLDGIQQRRANIRAARVLADGTVREPNGFTVTDSALPEDLPTVVGGGGNSWILFSALHGANGVPETQRIGYQFGPTVDYVIEPFERTGTDGSLVSASSGNIGRLAFPAEVHDYEFQVAAGEQVTAIVTPTDETVTLTAEFAGLSSTATAPAPGAPVIVQLTDVPNGGIVTLNVSGDAGTPYEFEVHRNVNLELLIESATPIAIDDSRIEFGEAGRFAALGQSSGQVGGAGFDHYSNPSLFVDISSTGTSLTLDDGFYGNRAYVSTTVGNDIFPSGTITVARDGIIVSGINDTYLGAHEMLPDTFRLGNAAALAPLWSPLGASNSTGLGDGAVYVEERIVNDVDALIVQWHEVPAWHDVGAATFQIQVFASGPVKSRFVYQDITFGHPIPDGGANASIGVQLNGSTGYQFSFETPSLSDGDVLDFLDRPTVEDVDDMTVDLTAGDTIDVALSGIDESFVGASLELLDASDNLLTTGSPTFAGQPITNFEQGILGYEVPVDGTYTVRVKSPLESRYSVVVTQQLVLDTEPNSDTPLRTLNGSNGALGYLSPAPSLAGHTHYNDPSLFVDISQTGSELFFDHGDGVAAVHTNIGNAVMPAGKFLVGNDGALMQDEDLSAFSGGNSPLPTNWFDFAALVPFWTDLEIDTGAVYVEEQVIDGVDALVVQWHNRSYFFQSGTGTFQVQLFARDPSAEKQLVARYVYQDVDFNNPIYNGGIDATVGLQLDPNTATTVSFDTASLSDEDVIDFYVVGGDRFALDLAAGEAVTLRTSTPLDGPSGLSDELDPAITVLDSSGVMLATDANSADGKNASLAFTAPEAGTYLVSVFAESGSGEYVLHKFDGTHQIDGDFNDDGAYDVSDIDMLTTAISTGGAVAEFDLSGDDQLSMDDVNAWLAEAGELNLGSGVTYLPADANLDGVVDGIDFLTWNSNKFTNDTHWSHGDFNADGVVDGIDFIVWNTYKFLSADFASASPNSSTDGHAEIADTHPSTVDRFFSTLHGTAKPTRDAQSQVRALPSRPFEVELGAHSRRAAFSAEQQASTQATEQVFAELQLAKLFDLGANMFPLDGDADLMS